MIEGMRILQNGNGSRVQLDDGKVSEWLPVCNGPSGIRLSSAAVVGVLPQRSDADSADISDILE